MQNTQKDTTPNSILSADMRSIKADIKQSLNFEDVSNDDIPRLIRTFRQNPHNSCDFSVGGVIIWKNYFHYKIAEYDGSLFIKGKDPDTDTTVYYPPIGDINSELASILLHEEADGEDAVLVDYTEDTLQNGLSTLPGNYHKYGLRREDWDEYVYDIEQFTTFAGKKMEKKRNHLNYFRREYANAVISPLKVEDIPELVAFTHEQQLLHDEDDLFSFDIDNSIDLLQDMEHTNLFGITIRVEGKLIGYSFGEVIGNMLYDHVEKGDIGYRGVYQALSSEMAKEGKKRGAIYMNREDDMGNPSLKKSKESYHPVKMIRKKLYRI